VNKTQNILKETGTKMKYAYQIATSQKTKVKHPCHSCSKYQECNSICSEVSCLIPSVHAGDLPNKISLDKLIPINTSRTKLMVADDKVVFDDWQIENTNVDNHLELFELINNSMDKLSHRQRTVVALRSDRASWTDIKNELGLSSRGGRDKLLYTGN
jgi:hypothetical protein